VKSGLEDDNIVFIDEIDKSVLLVNSSGPTSFKNVAERFRFADSVGWVAQHVFQKSIQTPQGCFVV
jgi:hypothetical protein